MDEKKAVNKFWKAADERSIVEKILAGEVQISNCDLNADFDHNEIRMLLASMLLSRVTCRSRWLRI